MIYRDFQRMVAVNRARLYRDMPWRDDTRPYYVLVSEIMLQQTQVARVIPKFNKFIARFPDEESLARATLADVLVEWQGLGYNRRAKYLHDSAKMIVGTITGVFPRTAADLQKLPGVGKNTAAAIMAYAFNQPEIFIETNIRTVYIHYFFHDQTDITDKQITALLEQTIDTKNPRQFYQNLMDYGAWLKANGTQNIAKSRHYKKQSKFAGSIRQLRGRILRELAAGSKSMKNLNTLLENDERLSVTLSQLEREGLITTIGQQLSLTEN